MPPPGGNGDGVPIRNTSPSSLWALMLQRGNPVPTYKAEPAGPGVPACNFGAHPRPWWWAVGALASPADICIAEGRIWRTWGGVSCRRQIAAYGGTSTTAPLSSATLSSAPGEGLAPCSTRLFRLFHPDLFSFARGLWTAQCYSSGCPTLGTQPFSNWHRGASGCSPIVEHPVQVAVATPSGSVIPHWNQKPNTSISSRSRRHAQGDHQTPEQDGDLMLRPKRGRNAHHAVQARFQRQAQGSHPAALSGKPCRKNSRNSVNKRPAIVTIQYGNAHVGAVVQHVEAEIDSGKICTVTTHAVQDMPGR